MKNVRHWWIQKSVNHNVPQMMNGASFCEFSPTVSDQGCEWIKVYSADDIQREIGMGITRYVEVCQENGRLKKALYEVSRRHDWHPDMGQCICQPHLDAMDLLKDYKT